MHRENVNISPGGIYLAIAHRRSTPHPLPSVFLSVTCSCSRIWVHFSIAASAVSVSTQICACVREKKKKKHSAFLVLVWIFVSDCSRGCAKCENPRLIDRGMKINIEKYTLEIVSVIEYLPRYIVT